MRYALCDVELTAPLPELRLAADQSGVALLLRVNRRPIHFSMHELRTGAVVPGASLWRLAGADARLALMADRLRDELSPAAKPPPVSFTAAICTRARPRVLADCLRSLAELQGQHRAFEILVVDNDPPDDTTRALVDGMPSTRYAFEPRPGLDFARNRALAEATGDFVAFLDDDVVVDRGWLTGLCEAIAENPDAGMVTGLVLPYELESAAQILFERRGGFRRGFKKLRYQGRHQPHNPLYPTGAGMFGAGCNMVVRRDLALELGGFDVALDTGPPLPGGGDLDMFYRVVRSGHPLVYEPAMLVFHRHRRDRAALRRQYWSWGEGFMAYVMKTYQTELDERPKLRALIGWWLNWAARQPIRSALGRAPGAPDLPFAELAGGLVGLAGSYERSWRRIGPTDDNGRHG